MANTKLQQVTVINEAGEKKLGWMPLPYIGMTSVEIVPREMGSDKEEIANTWTVIALHDHFATYDEVLKKA